MRRFRFSQDSLLRLKDQQRRQAEGRLQLALYRRDNTMRELRQVDAQLLRLVAGPAAAERAAVASAWLWCRWASQLQAVRSDIQHRLAQEENACQQAREELKRLEIDVEALTYLHSLRWQEHRKEIGLQTQREMDTIAILRWMRARDARQEACKHV